MDIDRRQLALPVLAIGLLGVMPAYAGADEDAVAKNLEAFRAAQASANAEILASLCAAELSYSHSSGVVEDKATFVANATNGKSKWLSLVYENPSVRVVGPVAIVRFHWPRRGRVGSRRQEELHQPAHPDELGEAGFGLEAVVARGDQARLVEGRMNSARENRAESPLRAVLTVRARAEPDPRPSARPDAITRMERAGRMLPRLATQC